MTAKNRRKNSAQSVSQSLVVILLGIIAIETFLLARIYLQHPSGRSEHAAPVLSFPKKSPPPQPQTLIAVPTPAVSEPAPSEPIVPVSPTKRRGKIAIIIDDNGYSANECTQLSGLSIPVAVSVLPNLEFSRPTAICSHRYNKDVMLHLPLEPYINTEKYPDNYIIKTTMPPKVVQRHLNRALASVPFATGINNHMGSKATENYPFMSALLLEIKTKKLFFVDSVVTGRSVCRSVAQRVHILFGSRDVFLDNQNERAYIEGQFQELARVAERRGYAVGIGHARSLTWQILKEQAESLANQGFEFVTIRSLLRYPAAP